MEVGEAQQPGGLILAGVADKVFRHALHHLNTAVEASRATRPTCSPSSIIPAGRPTGWVRGQYRPHHSSAEPQGSSSAQHNWSGAVKDERRDDVSEETKKVLLIL